MQKFVYNAGSKSNDADEEFIETEYYKDLNCVDKHHHTVPLSFVIIILVLL